MIRARPVRVNEKGPTLFRYIPWGFSEHMTLLIAASDCWVSPARSSETITLTWFDPAR